MTTTQPAAGHATTSHRKGGSEREGASHKERPSRPGEHLPLPAGEASSRSEYVSLLHVGVTFTGVLLAGVAVLTAHPELAALAVLCLLIVMRPSPTQVVVNRAQTGIADGHLTGVIEIAGTGALPTALQVRCAGVDGQPTGVVVAAQRPTHDSARRPSSSSSQWLRHLPVEQDCVRTGPLEALRLEVRAQGAGRASALMHVAPLRLYSAPRLVPLPQLPQLHRLVGAWGPREARRAGQGTRFFDVAPYVAGARLSRISWRATARHAVGEDLDQLYAVRTHAGAEAVVMVVVDSRDDIGPDADTWAGAGTIHPTAATSLDRARTAALAVAHAHLQAGDRVGLIDLADPEHSARPAAGKRAEERLIRRLTLARPPRRTFGQVRAPRIISSAAVWLISTLLDDAAASLALQWAHSGHQVYVIDVLPPGINTKDTALAAALRVEFAERHNRLARLREAGIAPVAWREMSGPDLTDWITLCTRGR